MLFSFRSSPPRYTSIEDTEMDEELKIGGDSSPRYIRRSSVVQPSMCSTMGFVLMSILFGMIVLVLEQAPWARDRTCPAPTSGPAAVACVEPTVRREWRSLGQEDRTEYIDAVHCLMTKPSRLRDNGTLYDDFPWVHRLTASNAHQSAPSLPWHRYYIHVYEKALQDECAYRGALPYWDWSQDWQNFENAPIFDGESGFGGDGDASGETTVGDGRCVTDGPFAGLEAMYYDDHYQPHCLSRGFSRGEDLAKLTELIQPQAIDELMKEPDF